MRRRFARRTGPVRRAPRHTGCYDTDSALSLRGYASHGQNRQSDAIFPARRAPGESVEVFRTDVAIILGGLGGCAAALAAARLGQRVLLAPETHWVGGQLTNQAAVLTYRSRRKRPCSCDKASSCRGRC
jgi:FAD dependent oxidoreductase